MALKVVRRLGQGKLQLLTNVAWQSADQVLRLGLGLLVGVWVARYLGPQQYGLFTYAATIVALISPLAKMGLDSIIIRDIAQDPGCRNEVLGTAFVLKLLGGIASLLLSLAVVTVLNPGDAQARWLVALIAAGTIFQAFETIDFWFSSQLQAKTTVVARNITFLIVSLVKVAAIVLKLPLMAFAAISLAEVALTSLSLIVAYRYRGFSCRQWHVVGERGKAMLKESWPLLLAGFSVLIYSKIDQVMLGSLLPTKDELGQYSVAVRLAEAFDFLPLVLQASFMPKLASIKPRDAVIYAKSLQVYFDIMLITWLIAAVIVSVFASAIINALYGEAYAHSASILSLYFWGQFGCNLGVARNTLLMLEGKQQLTLYISVLGAGINVLSNLLLIPRYGAMGATVATIITLFITTVLLNYLMPGLAPVRRLIERSLNLFKAVHRIMEALA